MFELCDILVREQVFDVEINNQKSTFLVAVSARDQFVDKLRSLTTIPLNPGGFSVAVPLIEQIRRGVLYQEVLIQPLLTPAQAWFYRGVFPLYLRRQEK